MTDTDAIQYREVGFFSEVYLLRYLLPTLLLGCAMAEPARENKRGIFQGTPEDAIRDPTPGDTGKSFSTVDEAALDSCEWLWTNLPTAKQWEFCGVIFRTPEGIKVGIPVTKKHPGKCTVPLEPSGTTIVGEFHNHRLTEFFSDVDLPTRWAIGHYLCTPSGGVLRYTIKEGTVKLK